MRKAILCDSKIRQLIDTTLTIVEIRELAKAIHQRLPKKKILEDVVYESLTTLAARRFSAAVLDGVAWRIAGNLPRLESFHPATPWNRQPQDEYVPVQVSRVARSYRFRKPLAVLTLKILAGTPAGLQMTKQWSPALCRALAYRLGYERARHATPFRDTRELVGFRFYALLQPDLCRNGPDFESLWLTEDGRRVHPGSCYSFNRDVIRTRSRSDDFTCPQNYDPVDVPCYRCWIGRDRCLAAVHDKTFEKRRCDACEKEALFDPALVSAVCIDCYDRQLRSVE